MTVWDTIYKDYKEGGDAWATLSEGIIPEFVSLVENYNFPLRNAFDVGCGTGKYLRYLQSKSFDVSGVDSSETAVEFTKDALSLTEGIVCADMFQFDLGTEKYDLILSVSTIHHGMKSEIEKLVGDIYKALVPSGKIFITVPDYQSAIERNEFEGQEKLDIKTYASQEGPEKGLAHSFYDKEEVVILFSRFKDLTVSLDEIGRWVIMGEK